MTVVKPKPFRFGVVVRKTDTGRAWADRARLVEDSGFSTLLLPDHFVGPRFAPIAAMTAAAATTTAAGRHPGALQRLPAPGRAGQRAGDAGRPLRRAARRRHRHRLDASGLRPGRRAVRPAQGPIRAVRRGHRRAAWRLERRAVHLSGAVLPARRARAGAEAGPEAVSQVPVPGRWPEDAAHGRQVRRLRQPDAAGEGGRHGRRGQRRGTGVVPRKDRDHPGGGRRPVRPDRARHERPAGRRPDRQGGLERGESRPPAADAADRAGRHVRRWPTSSATGATSTA